MLYNPKLIFKFLLKNFLNLFGIKINKKKIQEIFENTKFKDFTLDDFISHVFSNKDLSIVQIGANDGESGDPINQYLKNHSGKVILIEAVPYYCKILEKIYQDKDNIVISNTLISNDTTSKDFFYIDPSVADEMDGNGPMNKWAHGQGSLNKETIIYWINKNKFRGSTYRKNIKKYINSIKKININTKPLNQIVMENGLIDGFDLLLLDVQGHEYEVLKNLEYMKKLPKYIIYEDDSSLSRGDSRSTWLLLKSLGYFNLIDDHDNLWIKV